MDTINETSSATELRHVDSSCGPSRRGVLKGASAAAGALAGVSPVLADTAPATGFGAPLVEVQVPAGVLTLEQKGAMIKGRQRRAHPRHQAAAGPG